MAIYVALFEENVSFYVLVGLTVYKKEFKTSEVLKKTFYLSPRPVSWSYMNCMSSVHKVDIFVVMKIWTRTNK